VGIHISYGELIKVQPGGEDADKDHKSNEQGHAEHAENEAFFPHMPLIFVDEDQPRFTHLIPFQSSPPE
jgi:hypothetical protein